MTEHRYPPTPPGGTIPVTMPGDLVLARTPHLVVWAGAITAFPDSFEFTLLILADTSHIAPPGHFALNLLERDRAAWLSVRFSDGRYRAADMNTNTPHDQPQGPHLGFIDGNANSTEGYATSRWWVRPLPPRGPVELSVHLDGANEPTGRASLDGSTLADAAARAEILWPDVIPD